MPARKHGLSRTPAYSSWCLMHRRCDGRDPRSDSYLAKGVQVCDRWSDFELFLEDMGQPPPGMTLGRKDNDGPYCKENCRWETDTQQQRNRSDTVWLTAFGQSRPVADWAGDLGCELQVIKRRLEDKWSVGDAVSKPLRSGGYKKKQVAS
jgi:hypothetical protein